MRNRIRWATTVIVAATAVALGLSSASATTPTPAPVPPPAAPGHPSAGKTFDPATYRSARTESIFVAVTPCRVADTRKAGGALATLAIRNFYVRGTSHFLAQGGTSGGCGIPAGATAVATNVTVVASGSGYLSGYPYGTGEPNTNFVTYQGGHNITANPVLPLAYLLSPDLNVRNHGTSSAQVIIDVTGYYAPQIQGFVETATGKLYSGSTRLLSVTRAQLGVFEVKVDSDVAFCTPAVTTYIGPGSYANAYAFNGNTITVSTWHLSATGTPVAFDAAYFYLTVTC